MVMMMVMMMMMMMMRTTVAMLMMMLMVRLTVRIHSIVIRITHRNVIHPTHRANMRRNIVKLCSVRHAVLLRLHVKTPLVADTPTIMFESRLAVLVGAIAVHAIKEGNLLQIRT